MNNETIDNLINFDNVINNKLGDIKRAFISFYGVENAELINEKLSNVLFISHTDPDTLKYEIRNATIKINNELVNDFFVKTGLEPTDDNKRKLLSADISNYFITPIGKYAKYKSLSPNDEMYDYRKKDADDFVLSFYGKSMNSLTSKELASLDNMCNVYEELVSEYNNRIAKYKPYNEYADACNELSNKIKKKYFIKYIENNIEQLSDKEKEMFDKYKNSEQVYMFFNSTQYFAQLNVTAEIEYFTKENTKLAKNGNLVPRYSQIEFFKRNGIDLGNDYDVYLKNKECQKIIKESQAIAEKMHQERLQLYDEYLKEYYSSLPEFVTQLDKINQQNYYSKDQTLEADTYINKLTCVSPNLKVENGQYRVSPILFFGIGDMIDYSDARLIHELNHVLELTLTDVDEEKMNFICGWDNITCCVEEKNISDELGKRDYELFNEIVNELLAQKITTKLHEQGKYIFNNENNAQIKGATSYEHTMFLVKDFFNTYKDEIIESRHNGNINIILEKVGKENFDALNNLFHEYNDYFSGNKFYSLCKSLKNNEENEDTKKYDKIVAKRDNILKNMAEYSLEKDVKIVS